MRFTIRIEQDSAYEEDRELYSLEELQNAVDRLDRVPGSFLTVMPETPIDTIVWMQAAFIQKTGGLFRKKVTASFFQVEVQEERSNGDLYHYTYDTQQKEEVLQLFLDFFQRQRVPRLAGWESELFWKEEM